MPNLKTKINRHDKKILNETPPVSERICNCIREKEYPVNGKLPANKTLYTATVASSNKNYEPRAYKAIFETTFILGYVNHKKPLNLQNYIKNFPLNIGN